MMEDENEVIIIMPWKQRNKLVRKKCKSVIHFGGGERVVRFWWFKLWKRQVVPSHHHLWDYPR